ncbi:MAG: polymer-forming cytoskeletal protein [Myxococcota bacterium]
MADPCIIGPGTVINGRLTGDEEVVVEGRIEGTVELNNHLLVEASGQITADVRVVAVTVRGQLRGQITASDVVTLEPESIVVGTLKAPRIIIEDGARFKGDIDMDVSLPEGLQG